MGYWYRTGTISVANGDTTVTGTLTGWASTVRAGDMLHAGGNPAVEIASVTDNTHFELVEAWPYTTLTDATYGTELGPGWNDVTRLANEVATALANSTEILSGTGVPSDAIGSDGSAYFRQDAPELYFKSSGSWGSPIDLTGPQGPAGANNITSSTTSRTLNTGSMAFTVDAGKAIQTGMRMRVSNSGSNYMEGVVTSYSGTTLTISMDRFVGSGTYAVWAIAPVGDKGDTGATGASYAGTSTTSLTIGTGSQAFTTQAGLAYVVGSPIRLASAANPANFMEGVVAAYSGTSMTATIAVVGGSGTLTDWNLSLTGRQGATGSTGSPGPANSLSIGTVTTGAAGSSADATITGTAPSQTLNLTIPKGDAGVDGTDGADGADGSLVTASSTTSLTPSVGTAVFTVASGLSFISGMRVRGASTSNLTTNWFSGIVSSYATTSLTIEIDAVGPSVASASNWNIALTGEPGPTSGGDVVGPSSSVDQRLAAFNGTTGKLLQDSGVTAADIIAAAVAAATAPRNRTINPQFFWAQAGVGSVTDGNYSGVDQWYVLTQTAAVASTQLTNIADGLPSMGRLTQSQATAQRMGWAQVFESSFVKDLRSKTVTLAAKVRMSAATTLRFAIIEWTGTADTVTKDVVNSWTNTTFTAGQFFASSNLTIAATGSLALSASTVTDVTLSAAISSSMNNLIIFFWTDSAQAQTVSLDLGNVFFGQGLSAPINFDPPAPEADLRACQRYYSKSYNMSVAVGTTGAVGAVETINVTTTNARNQISYKALMRVTPTITLYNSTTGAAGSVRSGGTNINATSIDGIGESSFAGVTVASGLTVSQDTIFHYTADARL